MVTEQDNSRVIPNKSGIPAAQRLSPQKQLVNYASPSRPNVQILPTTHLEQ
jgi:hypothetical protein